MLKHLEKLEDFDKIIAGPAVLVDFYADWCGPCQMLAPNLEALSKESNVEILKVDVDEFGDIAQKLRVMNIPTLMFFKEGKLVKREMGYIPIERLRELIK